MGEIERRKMLIQFRSLTSLTLTEAMGGGNSVIGLPVERKKHIVIALQQEYERLKSQGSNNEEMNAVLQTLYKKLELEDQNSSRTSLVSGNSVPTGPLNRRGTGILKEGRTLVPPGTKIPKGPILDECEEEEEDELEGKPKANPLEASKPAAAHVAPAAAKPITVAKPTPTKPAAGAAAKPVGLPKGEGKGSKNPTRRRSFDPTPPPQPTTLVGSQSTQILPTVADAALTDAIATAISASDAASASSTPTPSDQDHWDSVSQLPYCKVCQMAFKSASLLDRHVKYSDLHERTLKKQEAAALKAVTSTETTAELPTSLSLLQEKQVEGQDFKHLYYGSKFFWRTKDNVDFTFFHHLLLDTIEIVAFSVYKNKELNRIYLNLYIINQKLEQQGLLVADTDTFLKNAKEKQSAAYNREEANRTAVTTFILSRLQLEVKQSGEQVVKFIPASADDSQSTPLLPEKPNLLIPRPVVHRRNTSTEEITTKLADLAKDQALLAAATNRAEKIGSYVLNFATSFKNSSKRLREMTLPKRRWVMAVHRVMQINGVKKTALYLEQLEEREAKRVSAGGAAIVNNRRGRSNTNPDV